MYWQMEAGKPPVVTARPRPVSAGVGLVVQHQKVLPSFAADGCSFQSCKKFVWTVAYT